MNVPGEAAVARRRLFDAHNHLQDERFGGREQEHLLEAESTGVAAMVVNGCCEADWNAVEHLARSRSSVIPSYGLHPWYHATRSPTWLKQLAARLDADPRASIGEIGLDRWKEDLPYTDQEEVFLAQWTLARERNRPASIHCLKAWGRLHDLLREHPGPACGFLLHSYGGPAEMVEPLARLGARFSFPGFYLHARKEKQRAAFLRVPIDRLLLETDAPDQLLPNDLNRHPLTDPQGKPINHPANLLAVYEGFAALRGLPLDELSVRVEENFRRLFGA